MTNGPVQLVCDVSPLLSALRKSAGLTATIQLQWGASPPHAPAPPPWPAVSLEDLRPITAREHAAARAVIARVQALIAWRDEPHAGLDPATDLPAGGWRRENETNDFMDAV